MNQYSRQDLEKLSYSELHAIEDDLLFENEVLSGWRIRASAGRMLWFVLTSALWFTFFWSGDRLIPQSEARGLIQFVWFFGSLILAGFSASFLWKMIGMKGRQFVRLALHYWPVTMGLILWLTSR